MDKWQELKEWYYEQLQSPKLRSIERIFCDDAIRKMAELEAREQDIKNKYANMLKPLPTKSKALRYAKLAQRLDELKHNIVFSSGKTTSAPIKGEE